MKVQSNNMDNKCMIYGKKQQNKFKKQPYFRIDSKKLSKEWKEIAKIKVEKWSSLWMRPKDQIGNSKNL